MDLASHHFPAGLAGEWWMGYRDHNGQRRMTVDGQVNEANESI
jgi:hypothetical protein